MLARRLFIAAAVFLVTAPAGRCQTYLLAEPVQVGDCFHVTLDMKLTGEIRVRKGNELVKLKLSAEGSHEFPERVLAVADGLAQKVARLYETAKAVITVDGRASVRTLRPERRLVVAQRTRTACSSTAPAAPSHKTSWNWPTIISTPSPPSVCCRARRSRSAMRGRFPTPSPRNCATTRG